MKPAPECVYLGKRCFIVPLVLGGTSMKRSMIRLTLGLAAMCVVMMAMESSADARLFGGRGNRGGRLFGGHRHGCHQQSSCCEQTCEQPVCETECSAPVQECASECCDSGCGRRHHRRHRHGGGCGCESSCESSCGCGGEGGYQEGAAAPSNGGDQQEGAPAPAAPEAPAEPAAPAEAPSA